jgi:hypothetical protein
MIAQQFITADVGVPDKESLEQIMCSAAIPMKWLRTAMEMKLESFEDVDMLDMKECLLKFRKESKSDFKKLFPFATKENVENTTTMDFHNDTGSYFSNLQCFIEERLVHRKRVACSIWFRGHVVTGCFDKMERKSYFIDSLSAHYYSTTSKSGFSAESVTTRYKHNEFGVRVTSTMTKKGTIDNFMECFNWWISRRIPEVLPQKLYVRCMLYVPV